MDTSLRRSRIIETDRSAIEDELSRLLSEKRFSGAPQMSAFLQYIVSETLNGNGDRIKAYTVGVDALGKPHTFDAQSDPSVRVLALRLRKTLVAIYESDVDCHVRISLNVGTYVPEFFKVEAQPILLDVSDKCASELSEQPHQASGSTLQTNARPEPVNISQTGSSAGNSSYSLPDLPDSSRRSSDSTVIRNMPLSGFVVSMSLMLLTVIFLFFWLTSGAQNNIYMHKLSAGLPLMITTEESSLSEAAMQVDQQSPSVYLVDDTGQSRHLHQISMLLGSSVAQFGSVNVIRVPSTKVPEVPALGAYHMILVESHVDSQSRIDAQLLRSVSGVVVASSTMMFDSTTTRFTSDEVSQLEELAEKISDTSGPLFKDFCMTAGDVASASCVFDEVRAVTVVNNGSDAV